MLVSQWVILWITMKNSACYIWLLCRMYNIILQQKWTAWLTDWDSWRGTEKKTKPNTTKARIHQWNVIQHKINTKTKARFSRLLWHPAWKWSGSVLNGKDKWGSIQYKQANSIYSVRIKNRINGASSPGACTSQKTDCSSIRKCCSTNARKSKGNLQANTN